MPKRLKRLLPVKRYWIVDRCWNVLFVQVTSECIPFGCDDDEQMVIAPACFFLCRDREFCKCRAVDRGNLTPAAVRSFQSLKFDAQDRRLQFVEPAVVSQDLRSVILPLAIVPQQAGLARNLGVGRDDHAAVSVTAEVFRGVKTERSRGSEGAASTPGRVAAMSLRRILNERNSERGKFLESRRHSIEMYRDCSLRP